MRVLKLLTIKLANRQIGKSTNRQIDKSTNRLIVSFSGAKLRRIFSTGIANLAKKMAFSDILLFLPILAKSSTKHPLKPYGASNSSDRSPLFSRN